MMLLPSRLNEEVYYLLRERLCVCVVGGGGGGEAILVKVHVYRESSPLELSDK